MKKLEEPNCYLNLTQIFPNLVYLSPQNPPTPQLPNDFSVLAGEGWGSGG